MNGDEMFVALFHISGSVGVIRFDPGITILVDLMLEFV